MNFLTKNFSKTPIRLNQRSHAECGANYYCKTPIRLQYIGDKCESHANCKWDQYCRYFTGGNECADNSTGDCEYNKDPVGDKCPPQASDTVCTTHADCAHLNAYCTSYEDNPKSGTCYREDGDPVEVCKGYEDGITCTKDGNCIKSCVDAVEQKQPEPEQQQSLAGEGESCWGSGNSTEQNDANCQKGLKCARKGYDGRIYGGESSHICAVPTLSGEGGQCWASGNSVEQNDANCQEGFKCARKGFDGRDYGGDQGHICAAEQAEPTECTYLTADSQQCKDIKAACKKCVKDNICSNGKDTYNSLAGMNDDSEPPVDDFIYKTYANSCQYLCDKGEDADGYNFDSFEMFEDLTLWEWDDGKNQMVTKNSFDSICADYVAPSAEEAAAAAAAKMCGKLGIQESDCMQALGLVQTECKVCFVTDANPEGWLSEACEDTEPLSNDFDLDFTCQMLTLEQNLPEWKAALKIAEEDLKIAEEDYEHYDERITRAEEVQSEMKELMEFMRS